MAFKNEDVITFFDVTGCNDETESLLHEILYKRKDDQLEFPFELKKDDRGVHVAGDAPLIENIKVKSDTESKSKVKQDRPQTSAKSSCSNCRGTEQQGKDVHSSTEQVHFSAENVHSNTDNLPANDSQPMYKSSDQFVSKVTLKETEKTVSHEPIPDSLKMANSKEVSNDKKYEPAKEGTTPDNVDQQSSDSSENTSKLNPVKTYERRNKKKRPANYYDSQENDSASVPPKDVSPVNIEDFVGAPVQSMDMSGGTSSIALNVPHHMMGQIQGYSSHGSLSHMGPMVTPVYSNLTPVSTGMTISGGTRPHHLATKNNTGVYEGTIGNPASVNNSGNMNNSSSVYMNMSSHPAAHISTANHMGPYMNPIPSNINMNMNAAHMNSVSNMNNGGHMNISGGNMNHQMMQAAQNQYTPNLMNPAQNFVNPGVLPMINTQLAMQTRGLLPNPNVPHQAQGLVQHMTQMNLSPNLHGYQDVAQPRSSVQSIPSPRNISPAMVPGGFVPMGPRGATSPVVLAGNMNQPRFPMNQNVSPRPSTQQETINTSVSRKYSDPKEPSKKDDNIHPLAVIQNISDNDNKAKSIGQNPQQTQRFTKPRPHNSRSPGAPANANFRQTRPTGPHYRATHPYAHQSYPPTRNHFPNQKFNSNRNFYEPQPPRHQAPAEFYGNGERRTQSSNGSRIHDRSTDSGRYRDANPRKGRSPHSEGGPIKNKPLSQQGMSQKPYSKSVSPAPNNNPKQNNAISCDPKIVQKDVVQNSVDNNSEKNSKIPQELEDSLQVEDTGALEEPGAFVTDVSVDPSAGSPVKTPTAAALGAHASNIMKQDAVIVNTNKDNTTYKDDAKSHKQQHKHTEPSHQVPVDVEEVHTHTQTPVSDNRSPSLNEPAQGAQPDSENIPSCTTSMSYNDTMVTVEKTVESDNLVKEEPRSHVNNDSQTVHNNDNVIKDNNKLEKNSSAETMPNFASDFPPVTTTTPSVATTTQSVSTATPSIGSTAPGVATTMSGVTTTTALSTTIPVTVTTSVSIPSSTETTPTSTQATPSSSQTTPTQSPSSQVTVAAPAKPSSWAGLFKAKPATIQPMNPAMLNSNNSAIPDGKNEGAKPKMSAVLNNSSPKVVAQSGKPGSTLHQLGEILDSFKANHKVVPLQPRGLINRGNWCYINATLQALLACPPFYHLIKAIPFYPALNHSESSSSPIIDCIVNFMDNFTPHHVNKSLTKNKRTQDLLSGSSFEPTQVYKMLQCLESNNVFKHGKQEDAEEFLSLILNGLHDEMVAALKIFHGEDDTEKETKVTNGDVADEAEDDEDGWEQVGPKNKSVVTRVTESVPSPIMEVFGGQLRSVFHQQGCKESATLQPFFTLPLDIQPEKVLTLKDAIENVMTKEVIHGYTNSKTKKEVEAYKRLSLESMPPVLILHLKCFVYNKSGGIQKLLKQIEFGESLEISKDLLSANVKQKYHQGQRSYKLFAVVNHHGTKAVGGHYTTDIYHNAINSWIRCDDSEVKGVNLSQVLKFQPPKVPYLVYYRRCDLI
ncbi:unnamed protein product [Owenia fusiformis]|uniref:ubiquitinyl hydrolase 1 n=1 Tax=Owenia fusiformis TaxID=6347 RepID=A0A8J1XTD5_OWEFU|nr:unnamed protein product [Owenia fusiformis]